MWWLSGHLSPGELLQAEYLGGRNGLSRLPCIGQLAIPAESQQISCRMRGGASCLSDPDMVPLPTQKRSLRLPGQKCLGMG
ncbi:MAG: hypothetical protein RLZZ436_1324 [Planctomycetota bacterium]